MGLHKTIHSFYTRKEMPNITIKFYTKQMFVLVSMDILRLT